jgi:large subunit ribosomal protein L54
MKDLSVLKDKPDPVALPDEEYPAWLWTLTDEYVAGSKSRQQPEGSAEAAGFDMKAEKKKLRSK